VAEGYLAAGAGEQVQRHRADDRDVDQVEDRKVVVVQHQRRSQEDRQEDPQRELLERARKDLVLGQVAGEEKSALAVHG